MKQKRFWSHSRKFLLLEPEAAIIKGSVLQCTNYLPQISVSHNVADDDILDDFK